MATDSELAADARRLIALDQLGILDTPPEQRFDDIVALVRAICRAPVALLSIVATERQWFKARVGLDVCETDRESSFCGHAIVDPALFIIPDTLADARFADNPLVVDEPRIRFYAGAPLQLPGGAIVGTLCMIDRKPRELDELDRAIFGSLRDLVLGELIGQSADHEVTE